MRGIGRIDGIGAAHLGAQHHCVACRLNGQRSAFEHLACQFQRRVHKHFGFRKPVDQANFVSALRSYRLAGENDLHIDALGDHVDQRCRPGAAAPDFDLGYGELSCQGNPQIPTPNIDAIAKNGVRFTSGYVSGPYCSPTRAALLTGRYQQRFGHEFNPGPAQRAQVDFGISLNETTMAKYRPEMRKFYYDSKKYGTYLEQLGIAYPTVRKIVP